MLKSKLSKKTNKSYEDIHYSCTIRFLDDSEPLTVTYQKDSKGQWLVDYVCKELNLVEQDYFGLRYVDSEKQRVSDCSHWLDPTKTIYRQLKNVAPAVLCFRVKFYPTDPTKLKEEITRYFLFLQLRRDLHHGRLLCSPNDANEMAGYIIQSEVGDYDPQDHPDGYVNQFKMLPKQTQKQEEKISEYHRKFKGQVPSEMETSFLAKAASLETYGVDPHPVKDQKGNQMYLGVTHLGIVTFQGNKRTHLFKWQQITKIAFEGKMFIVHVIINEGEENALFLKGVSCRRSRDKKKHACGFKCATFSACKHLWKCAVEQQYFFTLSQSSDAKKVTSGGSFFTRGSKFRFSGRCQREVFDESASIQRAEPHFVRSSSNPAFTLPLSKSASLPYKFRDRNSLSELDMTGDTNHLSAIDCLLATSTPLEDHIDETIPEESMLELGDSPYRPLPSPGNEMPPFPVDTSSPESEDRKCPMLNDRPQLPADLDEQIQELQRELDQCRRSAEADGSTVTGAEVHSGEEPDMLDKPQYTEMAVDVQDTSALPPEGDTPATANHVPGTSVLPPGGQNPDTPNGGSGVTSEPESSVASPACSHALCCALTISIFVVFTAMLILAVLVLESDLDVPVLSHIRGFPEIQDFKYYHYNPFKNTVSQRMGTMFKR